MKFKWLCGLRVARDVGVIQLPCVVLWLALLFFYHVNVKLKKIHISQNGGVAQCKSQIGNSGESCMLNIFLAIFLTICSAEKLQI